MKKTSESKSAFLSSVVLHRNDIDAIVEILKDCEEINFRSGDYEYTTLEELINDKGNKLTNITIQGIRPYITLSIKRTLWPGGIHLFSSDGDNLAFFKIKEILLRNKRWTINWLLPLVLTSILTSYFFLIKLSTLPISNKKYIDFHTFVILSLLFVIPMMKFLSLE